jgi:hypothetical protein
MAVEYTQNSIHPKRVKQAPGQSTEDLISQKAVTDEFGKIRQVPAGTQGQIVGFDANGNPVAVEDGGGGTGVFAPVADLTALKALDTTIAEDWPDKWAIYVESVRLFYALDRESLAADDGDTVIAPTTGAGRWHRKVIANATENNDGLMSKESVKSLNGVLSANNETVITLTGILNDLEPNTCTLRFTGGAAVSISGISLGVDGKTMLLVNATAYDLTLMHENAGSAAGNRLIIQGADNVYIRPGGAARFRYSASKSAWQMTDLWGSEYFPTLKGATTRTMQVTPTGYAQAEENVELNTYLINQSTDFDKATLNTNYPDYVAGQKIICPNLTNGGKIYEKYDDSTNDWISYPVTVVL